jgi:hypothetical protein
VLRKLGGMGKNNEGNRMNKNVMRIAQYLCSVDRASRYIRVMKPNLMHYLSSVYFVNQPLHVSSIFVTHHQGGTVYIQQLTRIVLLVCQVGFHYTDVLLTNDVMQRRLITVYMSFVLHGCDLVADTEGGT